MAEEKITFRKILVATDFSEHAAAALHQAVHLAQLMGSALTVVHVIQGVAWAVESRVYEASWRIPAAEIKKVERKLRQQAEERLAEVIAPYRSVQQNIRALVLVGKPFFEIARAVQQMKYDLVVAGTLGSSGIKRLLVGSTAERLVRNCPSPVWIVKPGHAGGVRSILVAVDYSEVSAKGLRLGAFLARRFGAALSVMHVLRTIVQMPEGAADLGLRLQRREVRKLEAQRLRDFIGSEVPGGLAVQEVLGLGEPWQKIGLVARKRDVDLIVMGTIGRAGISGLLIGNTAEKVLRHCDRSILTVKADDFVCPTRLMA
jgi:nucleotide-binding universal stress UspA family protein